MATVRISPRNKGSRRLSLKTNSAKKRFLVLEVGDHVLFAVWNTVSCSTLRHFLLVTSFSHLFLRTRRFASQENAFRAFKGPDAGLIFNIPCDKIENIEGELRGQQASCTHAYDDIV
jgi:hypothetical protein